ncbi:MAG: DUF4349 domain-containing protein [Leptospiraceae bacterium]|nr:DUF4349 domain-containing protein [Leptospiraceae bacterium]
MTLSKKTDRTRSSILFTCFLLFVILNNCNKSEESTQAELSKDSIAMSSASPISDDFESEEIDAKMEVTREKKEISSSKESYSVKFSGIDPKFERLLEYQVNLEFESRNFSKTRDDLYKMAGSFGFLQQSNDSFLSYKNLNASVWVKTEKLYEFLEASNALGKLRSESISANDLTYENYVQNVTLNRELIRGQRRSKALSGSSDAKNYTDRERLLSESEEKEDSAKKEKWLINDRVSWAKVQISIIDPNQEKSIHVPDFSEVFYDLASFFLYLMYLGLYALPLIFIGIFIYIKRSFFLKLFSKNKN